MSVALSVELSLLVRAAVLGVFGPNVDGGVRL